MPIKFRGPVPESVLAFFRGKGLRPGFDYRDVWRAEHASAFTVAKAMQADVLTSIREAIDAAIAEGKTLRAFQAELTPTLQRLGWWGRKKMTDPETGEKVLAQLGSPRRLRTIYTANLRTARAAGQWERAQRTKAALPYLRYSLGPSEVHRPEHVAWDGTVLPVDHEFWTTHMPPNGWGCKCRVRQVSKVEMDRRDWQVSPDPQVTHVDWYNKRTGKTERVPAGIDPGWDTNPGRVRQQNLDLHLAGALDKAPEQVAEALRADLARYRERNAQ